MTLDELETQLFELEERRTNARQLGWSLTDSEFAQYRALKHRRDQLAAEHRHVADAETRSARRAELTAVLRPTENIRRAFIRRLGEHAIDVALEHQIRVVHELRRPRARPHQRQAFVPGVLTEAAYSTCLHEFGHCVSAAADGQQARHVVTDAGISAPAAEVAAWSWAINNACIWTEEMHRDLLDALNTYRAAAVDEELRQMNAIGAVSAGRIVPAPDTLAGRIRRANQVSREDKVRQIAAAPKLSARLAILRERGIAQ